MQVPKVAVHRVMALLRTVLASAPVVVPEAALCGLFFVADHLWNRTAIRLGRFEGA